MVTVYGLMQRPGAKNSHGGMAQLTRTVTVHPSAVTGSHHRRGVCRRFESRREPLPRLRDRDRHRTNTYVQFEINMHQSKKVLQRKRTHWSKLAKTCNTLRAGANPKKIFNSYLKLWDFPTARQAVSTLCPRPLKGRWGSRQLCEQYILNCGRYNLPDAYEDM